MNIYAEQFAGVDAVARYERKLANRIDRMRHRLELDVLARHARGALFDCTIGTGRFIGSLPQVSSYAGVDISPPFIGHIKLNYPGARAYQGDLTLGIAEADDSFDCVICLRSLSTIGHVDTVVPDMVRIARPGGVIIVDYGRRPAALSIKGHVVEVDGRILADVLARVDADVVERVRSDALLTRLKKRTRVFRFVTQGGGTYLPDAVLLAAEHLLAPFFWERQIVVLRKRGAGR